jgi:hypothetical protein
VDLSFSDVAIHKSHYDAVTTLDPWRWRLGDSFTLLLPTVLGHLFLERTDGTVWFLDTWSGELYQAAGNYDEFRAAVSGDQEFLSRWFMPELVVELRQAGTTLKPDECYTPLVSPGIGGNLMPANFMASPLRVHLATSAAECEGLR